MRAQLLLAAIALTLAQAVSAEDTLYLELWTERDSIVHPDGAPPEERLLRELQYVVSGLLYGFFFEYTPAYRDRGVEERFLVEPVFTIPWGDAAVLTLDVVDLGNTVYGQFLYQLNRDQVSRRERWQTVSIPDASGTGTAPIEGGYEAKVAAVEDALRIAVRRHLQSRVRNRPRQARGVAVLETAPRVFVDQGRYIAEVRTRLIVDEIDAYTVF